MTLTDLIVSIAGKAGITPDSELMKDLLANVELTKVNVQDELVSQLNKNLHSVASAKAVLSPTLRAESLNKIDKTLADFIIEDGWMPEDVEAIQAEQNTFKKLSTVLNKIKALEAEKYKSASGDGTKTKVLQDKINELQTQLTTIQRNHAAQIEEKSKAFDEQIINYMLQSTLSAYQYGIPVDDNDAKLEVARTLVKKALQSNQARLVNDNGQLKLVSHDGTDFFDKTTNTMKSAKDIIEGAISPILKKHEGAASNGVANRANGQPATTHTDGVNSDAIALLDAAIAQATGKN